MQYWQFLALFLGVPIVLLLAAARGFDRMLWLTLAGVSALALVYTGPWDNLIVANGVWSYGPRHVLGVVIGHVPLEEYGFYVLQVIMTGTLTAVLLRRR